MPAAPSIRSMRAWRISWPSGVPHVPKRFGELDAHETAGDLILQTTTLKVSGRVIVMLASLLRTGAEIPSDRAAGGSSARACRAALPGRHRLLQFLRRSG